MACTDVQTIQAGNGTNTLFSFDFPYIFKSEIHVYFWNVVTKEYDEKLTTDATYPWRITDANPTLWSLRGLLHHPHLLLQILMNLRLTTLRSVESLRWTTSGRCLTRFCH